MRSGIVAIGIILIVVGLVLRFSTLGTKTEEWDETWEEDGGTHHSEGTRTVTTVWGTVGGVSVCIGALVLVVGLVRKG